MHWRPIYRLKARSAWFTLKKSLGTAVAKMRVAGKEDRHAVRWHGWLAQHRRLRVPISGEKREDRVKDQRAAVQLVRIAPRDLPPASFNGNLVDRI